MMKTKSYKATIDVEDDKIKGFIKDLFGDTEEYDKKNKHFNNEKIKDAIFFLNSSVKHEEVPNKIWGANRNYCSDDVPVWLQQSI